MVIGRTCNGLIIIKGKVQHVEKYEYLEVTIISNGSDDDNISKKLGRAKAITTMLHPILWNNTISKKNKKQIQEYVGKLPHI